MEIKADYFRIREKRIWIEQIGELHESDSPTLVFLHEGLGSIRHWKDFPSLLCRTLNLPGIVYDRHGHGLSDPMTEDRDLDYMHIEAMDYLPEVLESFNIKRPILVGHSDGGTIALIYAAHYEVTALVTIAAHVYVEEGVEQGLHNTKQFYEHGGLKDRLERYHGPKTDKLFRAWYNTWTSEWFAEWNIEYLLKDIDNPTLVIQGDADEYAAPKHLNDIVNGIGPNATGLLLPDLDHSPHLQQMELLVDRISQFLEREVFYQSEED
ncbi:MAG: alpha/beta hydrolase [Bacteroidota bacterium]